MLTSVFAGTAVPEVDVVIGTSPSLFQAFSAWIVARVRRRPFVLEIRDLWVESAIELGLIRNAVLISAARAFERFIYKRADRIIVNSPAYSKFLRRLGLREEYISLVANGVDTSSFDPQANGETFRAEHGCLNKFVVMYAGALGLANDLDCLIRAAVSLRDCADIVFILVGGGKELQRLRSEVSSMKLTNVQFAGGYPKKSMSEVLAAADVCVATLKDVPAFRTTFPNKVFDYMASGRPTVLGIEGPIREVMMAARGGICVSAGDDAALARAIVTLRDASDLRRSMGMAARAYVTKHFDRQMQAREFARVLEQTCASAKGPAVLRHKEIGDAARDSFGCVSVPQRRQ